VRSQIKLGKIFGIEIGVHYSWFLIVLLIIASLSQQFHAENAGWSDGLVLAMAIVTGILFFVCLVLHELAHSVFARSHGMEVREITLFALGGVSQIEQNPSSAKSEFWMAFVGPLTSACIGLACVGVRRLAGNDSSPLIAIIAWLGYINLALAGFNMIPGYPLDGGRVLRAILWWKTGDADRSTRMAAKTGQAVGVFFIVAGIFQFFNGAGIGGLWISFIGWFLLQAAGQSYLAVGLTKALLGVTAGDLMATDCPTLDGNLNIQHFVDEELLKTGRRCFLILQNGTVAGLVTPHEIREIDRARWPYTTLSDVMRPIDEMHTIEPETPLKEALEIMGREDLNQLPVMKDGALKGFLSRTQVLDYFRTRSELHA
jgi:Zn-dependent protease